MKRPAEHVDPNLFRPGMRGYPTGGRGAVGALAPMGGGAFVPGGEGGEGGVMEGGMVRWRAAPSMPGAPGGADGGAGAPPADGAARRRRPR